MDIILLLKAAILGIVEGLTEFLPISSTGHLIILGDLLGYNDEASKVFKIVIQLAAILAICWDYRERLTKVVTGLPNDAPSQRFAILLVIGFLPAAILGLMFHSAIKTLLFNPIT
ncbi:MAG: undecaprenyl-diphosphate phosphatase, partial [Gallionella sp.]